MESFEPYSFFSVLGLGTSVYYYLKKGGKLLCHYYARLHGVIAVAEDEMDRIRELTDNSTIES